MCIIIISDFPHAKNNAAFDDNAWGIYAFCDNFKMFSFAFTDCKILTALKSDYSLRQFIQLNDYINVLMSST